MKILATFDGTSYGESIVPVLLQMAALPNASFSFLAVAHEPDGKQRRSGRRRPVVAGDAWGRALPVALQVQEPKFAEDKTQAIERRVAELEDYLSAVAARMPKGCDVHIEACVDDHVSRVIIDRARELEPDVIVMATHGSSGLTRALFGSTTEDVVRSGVAPVLVVHPKKS
jgi:nucleotide-binding universal stress UspA family protein